MKIILVIGDRPEQASALAQRFGFHGIEAVPSARDWKLAVRCLTSHQISLVLASVDRTQESIDFFSLLKELTDVPIIAFGPSSNADSIVWYLDHGAVDYIPAATPMNVLAAKVASRLREESPAGEDTEVIQLRDLTIDLAARLVVRGNRAISLTPLEFRLLSVLAQNLGKTCSRQMLLEQVWGKDFEDCAHYLRLYIGYLRQKLEANPARPRHILTDWGYGYRFAGSRPVERRAPARQQLRSAPSPG